MRAALIRTTLLLTALTGCQPVWVKQGESPGDFAATVRQCQATTRAGYFGNGIAGQMNAQGAMDRCIAGHGYLQAMPRDVPAGTEGHPSVAPAGIQTTQFPHEAGGASRGFR